MPEDGDTLAHVIGTVALHFGARTIAVGLLLHDFQLAGEIVKLGLYVCEAVDAADDHGSVLAQAVEDGAEWFLAHFVGHLGDLDGTLCGSK